MRRLAPPALALALGAGAALWLASCGGGEDAKLLPGNTAREINENLTRVGQLAGEGECIGAADAVQEVSTQVESLSGVDAKLKEALQRGTARLDEVIATCDEESSEAAPPAGEPEGERTTPTHQEEKEEKKREKEEEKLEKEEEKQQKDEEKEEEHKAGPPEEQSPEGPPPASPPSEGGGTGAPGGVSPNSAVGESD